MKNHCLVFLSIWIVFSLLRCDYATAQQVLSPKDQQQQVDIHEYANSVNRLSERQLSVTDNLGKPAVRGTSNLKKKEKKIADVKLEIVWTLPTQHSWNYCVPDLHDGKGLLKSKYPSIPLFLRKKLGAKHYLDVSIPDTPYSLYIIDGKPSPYFYDSERAVLWRLNGKDLTTIIHRMQSISTSSKKIVCSLAGGDMAEFFTLDFSNRDKSPRVKYWIRYDGF